MTQIIQNQSPQGPFRSSTSSESAKWSGITIGEVGMSGGIDRIRSRHMVIRAEWISMKLKDGFMIEMNSVI